MEAKELREGNTVLLYGNYFNVTIQSLYEGGNVDFKPVPITEELLMLFQFEKVDGKEHDYKISLQEDPKFYLWVDLQEQDKNTAYITITSENLYFYTSANFLHELQNIYFAVKGKELTKKPEIKFIKKPNFHDEEVLIHCINSEPHSLLFDEQFIEYDEKTVVNLCEDLEANFDYLIALLEHSKNQEELSRQITVANSLVWASLFHIHDEFVPEKYKQEDSQN